MSTGKTIFRLGGILFAVSAVIAFALGLVNHVTKDRIAEINQETLNAAMQSVLPADDYKKVTYTGSNKSVNSVYSAGDKGTVVEVTVSGSQGNIRMIVGVNADGTVSGISIVQSSETSGMGAIAASTGKDGEKFRSQFVGKTSAAVTKDGGDIDAITSATITSRAVCNGVNIALETVSTLG